MMRIFLLVSWLAGALFAANGELSLYVLKDGNPLPQQHVLIYKIQKPVNERQRLDLQPKAAEFYTDSEGYLSTALPDGTYQLQLIAKENGIAQAFVKKPFIISKGKQTQIILSLKSDNTLAFADTEAPNKIEHVEATQSGKKLEKGSIQLTLLSAEDQKPVEGARIFVPGLKVDAVSDKRGLVMLDLPEGNRTISIIHTAYSSQNVKVNVVPHEMKMKTVELSPASMELEEFVVLAPHIEGSVAAVIAQERNSDAVGNVLGSEQFSKSGDDDAAGALRRASGLTIVGGKYVFIRGLGDRYSTILFNGLNIPSPNPTKRVVPLDLFPTSAIKDITIQKSYTANLPGSFGGGTILINSVDIPKEEGFVKASVRAKYNSGTGQKAKTNPSPFAQIPGPILEATNNNNNINTTDKTFLSQMIDYRGYDPKSTTLPPGYKFSLAGGKSYETDSGWRMGATGSFFYRKDNDFTNVHYRQYEVLIDPNNSTKQSNKDVASIEEEYGGLFSAGLFYKKDHKIKYTFFTTKQNQDITTSGITTYLGSQPSVKSVRFESYKNSIQMHQLSGENHFKFAKSENGYFDDLLLTWALEKGSAKRLEPGSPEYQYFNSANGYYVMDKTSFYYLYSKLDDKVSNYRLDVSLPFEFNHQNNYTKVGYFNYSKERDFDSRLFRIMFNYADNNPILQQPMDQIMVANNMDAMILSQNSLYYDSYHATQKVDAYYINQLISPMENLDFIFGVRNESSTQRLSYTLPGSEQYPPLNTNDWFPGLGMTYRINDEMQLRLGYSKTITRPDFREFSANRYIDPITGDTVLGYEYLKPTYINNYDVKYEWYFSPGEMFSFALFNKEFTNPIETVQMIDINSGDSSQYVSFRNAKSATSYGVELDWRKRFGFLGQRWEKMLFATNMAYIKSNVTLDKNSEPPGVIHFLPNLTTLSRPMMGQSPYVINMTWGYDDSDTGNSALLLFNQIGKRLHSLGTYGNDDQYEQPFAKLDFVAKWNLNNNSKRTSAVTYALKFKATNLLDSKVRITQGGKETLSLKPGTAYSLTFSVKY